MRVNINNLLNQISVMQQETNTGNEAYKNITSQLNAAMEFTRTREEEYMKAINIIRVNQDEFNRIITAKEYENAMLCNKTEEFRAMVQKHEKNNEELKEQLRAANEERLVEINKLLNAINKISESKKRIQRAREINGKTPKTKARRLENKSTENNTNNALLSTINEECDDDDSRNTIPTSTSYIKDNNNNKSKDMEALGQRKAAGAQQPLPLARPYPWGLLPKLNIPRTRAIPRTITRQTSVHKAFTQ